MPTFLNIDKIDEATVHMPLRNVLNFFNSACLANAAIALATTKSKVKTVNSITFCINGVLYTKAGTDNFWTLSGNALNPDADEAQFCRFLLLIDAAGAMAIVQSDVETAAADVENPDYDTSLYCCVGTLDVATNAATTFTPGTTLLDAAGITDTYTNRFGPVTQT